METAWNPYDLLSMMANPPRMYLSWQTTADIAASCALSDAAAPRGKRA